jgi:hypothetical protein
LTLERLFIDDNEGTGIALAPTSGALMASDLLVRGGGDSAPALGQGRGVEVAGPMPSEIERVALLDNHEAGLAVATDTVLVGSDIFVRGTRPRTDGTFGRGINLESSMSVALSRVLVDGASEVGLFVQSAELDLTDATISRTLSGRPGEPSRGLTAQGDSEVTLERVQIRESREVGLELAQDARVTGTEVEIVDSLGLECPTGCPSPGGHSITVSTTGGLALDGFALQSGALCGLLLAVGEADLARGTVARHSIGACVQIDGYDLGRLNDDVVYIDNDSNLEATSLPVPEPLLP